MALSGLTWLAVARKEWVACGRKAPGGGDKPGCKGNGKSTDNIGSPHWTGCIRKTQGATSVAMVR